MSIGGPPTRVTLRNQRQVQRPGSRGATHWYYNDKHEVVYGDPPKGYHGFHSGDYHQMFTQHVVENPHIRNVVNDLHQDASVKGWTEGELAARAMGHVRTYHQMQVDKAKQEYIATGQGREKYHGEMDKYGNFLDVVHKQGLKHKFDEHSGFVAEYRKTRTRHAQHMVDSGRFNPVLPTPEELQNVPLFEDKGELEDWASTYLPHVMFEIKTMDLDVANKMVYGFLSAASEFDAAVIKNMRYFGTREEDRHNWGTEYAHAAMDGSLIGINPEFASDFQNFYEHIIHDHRIKWGQATRLEEVMRHEYGHMLDGYLYNHPQWAPLLEEWKRAHKDKTQYPAVSDYAASDDKKSTSNGRKEQWAESMVAMLRLPDTHSEYTRHQRRLLDFVRDNPDFTVETELNPEVLQHLGITDPIYVKVKG